jgi:hypothetical protein
MQHVVTPVGKPLTITTLSLSAGDGVAACVLLLEPCQPARAISVNSGNTAWLYSAQERLSTCISISIPYIYFSICYEISRSAQNRVPCIQIRL